MSKDQIKDAMVMAEIKATKSLLVRFFADNEIDLALAGAAMFSLQKDLMRFAGAHDLVDNFNKVVDEAARKEGTK